MQHPNTDVLHPKTSEIASGKMKGSLLSQGRAFIMLNA